MSHKAICVCEMNDKKIYETFLENHHSSTESADKIEKL